MKLATRLLAAVAVVACAFTVHAGAPPQIPVGVGASTVLGQASGSFNVPQQGDDGFVSGLLTLGEGFPFYALGATLPAAEVIVLPDGKLSGTLQGAIYGFPLSPLGEPDADLFGTWTWNPATGQGTFVGYLSISGPPGTAAPTVLVGLVGGRFQDPATPFGPDILGSFVGRWLLF